MGLGEPRGGQKVGPRPFGPLLRALKRSQRVQFSADTLWSLQPGFPHLASSHPVASRSWRAGLRAAAGEQRTRSRPWCATGPGALAAPGAGMVLAAASLLLSRALRPASTALPFLAGAGTGGGDQRPRQRRSERGPVPPPAGRADPHGAGGEGPPSGCPVSSPRPLPGVGTCPRRRSGGDSSLLFGAAAAGPGACSAGAGRTMLSCQLVRASNLPSLKKDRRSDPVASLTFRGESPVATAPARPRHPPARAPRGRPPPLPH